jgi:hypothetical protein
MFLSELSEITWQFYGEGRQKATTRSYGQQDVHEFLKMSVAEVLRLLYFSSKRNKDGDAFYFISPLLSIQNFPLSDADAMGMRRADMIKYDLMRAPHESHITNVYPKGCGDIGQSIDILENPGEEFFYAGKGKFKFFKFGVIKGRGINTYNLPACVKSIDVEGTFVGRDVDPDISLDVAYEASNLTLGKMIGIPEFTNKGVDNSLSPLQKNLRQRLSNQQPEVQA